MATAKMIFVGLGLGLGLLGLVEMGLRWGLGLGTPLLYVADDTMGYRLAPHQNLRRFGRRIVVNGFSMRHGPVEPTPPAGTVRLLLLGDSLVNGGWWTDQDQILSAQMQRYLQAQNLQAQGLASGFRVEVLNASANSWGPRNEWAYVERFGLFGAEGVVVLLNTDDLFGAAPSSRQVGRDRNYPDRLPSSALGELIQRYGKPARPLPPVAKESGDIVAKNLAALAQIQQRTQAAGIPLVVGLSPLRRELASQGGPRDYEQVARQRLWQQVQEFQGVGVDFLPLFNAHPQPLTLYRDHIHLSPGGNHWVAQVLGDAVVQVLSPGAGEPGANPTAP